MAFEVEVDDILRELLREPGTIAVTLVGEGTAVGDEMITPERLRRVPLGHGAELVITVEEEVPPTLDVVVTRVVRELQACILRYHVTVVPPMSLLGRVRRPRAALIRRMTDLLEALATMHHAIAAVVMRGPDIVARTGSEEPALIDRLAFLRKRLDAEASRQRTSSHAELVSDDVFARSFWFDAYLVLFFAGPGWPEDFVRHRVKAVTRELSIILPHLDDDPTTPAIARPTPEGS